MYQGRHTRIRWSRVITSPNHDHTLATKLSGESQQPQMRVVTSPYTWCNAWQHPITASRTDTPHPNSPLAPKPPTMSRISKITTRRPFQPPQLDLQKLLIVLPTSDNNGRPCTAKTPLPIIKRQTRLPSTRNQPLTPQMIDTLAHLFPISQPDSMVPITCNQGRWDVSETL